MQIGSLFMALGFDVDDKKLDQFTGKVKGLRGGLVGLAGVAAAGVGALSTMAITGSKYGQTLSNISQQSLQTTDDLQKFANVASGTNPFLSWEEGLAVANAMASNLVDMEWSQGAIGSLTMMNIGRESMDSVMSLLEALRGAWRDDSLGLTQGRKIKMFTEAGLPKSFINMITAEEGRYQELLSRDLLSQSDIDAYLELSEAMEGATAQAGLLSKELGAWSSDFLTPIFDSLANGLRWLRKDSGESLSNSWETTKKLADEAFVKPIEDLADAFSKESIANFMGSIRSENERLSLQRMKEQEPERFKDVMMKKYIEGQRTTTNNINIESTADAGDLVESLFDTITYQENISTANELPNTSRGGIR